MRSYDEILAQMQARYTELTGTEADKASDIGIRLKVLAAEVHSLSAELNWLKAQMFPDTAQGEYLDLHAAQRGLERKSGVKATGDVDFYIAREVNYDIEIPAGTVCAASGDTPIKFETTDSAVITAGHLSANAPISALEPGAAGNVMQQRINVLVTPIAEVVRVQNDYATEDGTDPESDEQLRARIIDSYINIPNGTNKAYYISQALSVEGVAKVGVIPRGRGDGTVDVYIAREDGTAPSSLIAEVKEKLQQAREINVDVDVKALRTVTCPVHMLMETKTGYEFLEVKLACENAIRSYFRMLGGGESVYLSDIGEVVAHVEGVKNYSFVREAMYDINISGNCVAKCGVVNIVRR